MTIAYTAIYLVPMVKRSTYLVLLFFALELLFPIYNYGNETCDVETSCTMSCCSAEETDCCEEMSMSECNDITPMMLLVTGIVNQSDFLADMKIENSKSPVMTVPMLNVFHRQYVLPTASPPTKITVLLI